MGTSACGLVMGLAGLGAVKEVWVDSALAGGSEEWMGEGGSGN